MSRNSPKTCHSHKLTASPSGLASCPCISQTLKLDTGVRGHPIQSLPLTSNGFPLPSLLIVFVHRNLIWHLSTEMVLCWAGMDICIPQHISTEPLRARASKIPEIPSPAGNHAARTSLPRQVALCLHLSRGIFKAVATLILSPETEHLMCPFTLPNHRVPSTRPFKHLIKNPLNHHYCEFRQRSCSGCTSGQAPACSPLGALRDHHQS